jgi:hypothetical protein
LVKVKAKTLSTITSIPLDEDVTVRNRAFLLQKPIGTLLLRRIPAHTHVFTIEINHLRNDAVVYYPHILKAVIFKVEDFDFIPVFCMVLENRNDPLVR